MDLPPRLARFFEPGSATQQLAGLLRAEGFRAYLVGGVVRDAFLDRNEEGYDIDITTDARPDAVARIVQGWADSVWLQGQRFGTVGGEKGGKTFEITTFRADVYHPESRKPEVTFADDIETDLLRRDFTVNALALDLAEPDLVDPSGGLADLSTRRLRTPMAPEVSFADDPLRMLRAARFVATLGFEPDPATVDAIDRDARATADHQRRTHPRRAVEAVARRRSLAGAVADRAHGAVGRVPARAQRDAPRTGSDPPPQGRARAHDRGRREDVVPS